MRHRLPPMCMTLYGLMPWHWIGFYGEVPGHLKTFILKITHSKYYKVKISFIEVVHFFLVEWMLYHLFQKQC